jgi:hypothetical protein
MKQYFRSLIVNFYNIKRKETYKRNEIRPQKFRTTTPSRDLSQEDLTASRMKDHQDVLFR